MNHLRLTSHDPSFNLALEEALWASLTEGGPSWFMLWRNGPSVIVGRHQNALEEVNREEVERRSLPVVRRSTGGGAVYHDLGNLNFSFLEWRGGAGGVDFARYLEPIVEALKRVGVDAEISGRNDLEVGGRKISGSAQRLARGRVLHHGTLLVDADFEAMTRALHPDPEKYMSHGVASVRSRVANIAEFWKEGTTLETLCDLLTESVGAGTRAEIPAAVLREAGRLRATRYGNWEWNIGSSPDCDAGQAERFPWGRVDVRYRVEKGRVAECRVFGDFFAVDDIALLEGALKGCPLEKEALAERLAPLDMTRWFSGCDAAVMRDFFSRL